MGTALMLLFSLVVVLSSSSHSSVPHSRTVARLYRQGYVQGYMSALRNRLDEEYSRRSSAHIDEYEERTEMYAMGGDDAAAPDTPAKALQRMESSLALGQLGQDDVKRLSTFKKWKDEFSTKPWKMHDTVNIRTFCVDLASGGQQPEVDLASLSEGERETQAELKLFKEYMTKPGYIVKMNENVYLAYLDLISKVFVANSVTRKFAEAWDPMTSLKHEIKEEAGVINQRVRDNLGEQALSIAGVIVLGGVAMAVPVAFFGLLAWGTINLGPLGYVASAIFGALPVMMGNVLGRQLRDPGVSNGRFQYHQRPDAEYEAFNMYVLARGQSKKHNPLYVAEELVSGGEASWPTISKPQMASGAIDLQLFCGDLVRKQGAMPDKKLFNALAEKANDKADFEKFARAHDAEVRRDMWYAYMREPGFIVKMNEDVYKAYTKVLWKVYSDEGTDGKPSNLAQMHALQGLRLALKIEAKVLAGRTSSGDLYSAWKHFGRTVRSSGTAVGTGVGTVVAPGVGTGIGFAAGAALNVPRLFQGAKFFFVTKNLHRTKKWKESVRGFSLYAIGSFPFVHKDLVGRERQEYKDQDSRTESQKEQELQELYETKSRCALYVCCTGSPLKSIVEKEAIKLINAAKE